MLELDNNVSSLKFFFDQLKEEDLLNNTIPRKEQGRIYFIIINFFCGLEINSQPSFVTTTSSSIVAVP